MFDRTKRRAVIDITAFCGLDYLEKIFIRAGMQSREHFELAVTLFETGCRVSELILLKPEQFFIEENNFVEFRNAKVLKIKQSRKARRDIIMFWDDLNPYVKALINFVEKAREKEWAYLFPARVRCTGAINPKGHCSRSTIYRRVREIDDSVWPHWFRDMRARFLIKYRFNDPVDPRLLQSWFGWQTLETATTYAKLGKTQIKRAMIS